MTFNEEINADKGPKVIIIITTFPVVALIAVILRLYTRIKIIHNQALDDWIAVVALLFSIATSAFMALQVRNGMGRHKISLTHQEHVNFFKTLYMTIIIYNIGLLFTKLSILFQYLRVATNKRIRLACYLVMLFSIVYGTEAFFTGVFHCWPIYRFWRKTKTGMCINKPILWFLNAGLNITNDILILMLPIFILKASTLPRKQKVGICLILSLGGFAAIVSVWRLYTLYIVSISKDLSWDIVGMVIWSCIELNVGIICACVSTLRPFTAQFIPLIHRNSSTHSEARHTSLRGNRGSELEADSSLIESQNKNIEMPGRGTMQGSNNSEDSSFKGFRNSTNDLYCIRSCEPAGEQNGLSGFKLQDNKGLTFSKLPNYPALVIVSTKR
ncbi:putative pth11-like integral membrane protein [Golovinomyces cichoracearum]|uniref:Putative pth11-like integral membrane protein n=1 Tax=Golovinomyces cichoracearum TaxID=62708 RepID=A0A420HGY4_9PEZI|nr:putative pth11-like integral membrane protein [Golovinomyces cichoracearum]